MADRHGPYREARFEVEVLDIGVISCKEVTIPDHETEAIEYRNGDDPDVKRQLWGLGSQGELEIKKGVTDTKKLFEWREKAKGGLLDDARSDIVVKVIDEAGEVGDPPQWTFKNCWPSKYESPDFDADGSDVAIESLTIKHEGVTREQ
jgi:phage tail-like protein